MAKFRIWTNFKQLGPDASLLRRLLPEHSIIIGAKSGDDPQLSEVDIAFGQPSPRQVIELTNLRWVHLNTAGYTNYDREDVRAALRSRGAVLTNSSTVYSEPCAQHALAMILSLARKLPQATQNQFGPRAWTMLDLRANSVLLNHQTALLVGFGSIGRRLAELLAPLGMQIVALRRTVRGDETVRTLRMDQLDDLLGWADHVINLLPASLATAGLFDAARFGRMKPGALFYNIGRGDTVDQDALCAALANGHLSAACLDVMSPEPLPPEHPLWTTPNCFITPHTAGGHSDELERLVRHFGENLRRLDGGERLLDQVI